MKQILSYLSALMVAALTSCTAALLPENPETPEFKDDMEKVSINVRHAEPASKAVINDSGSGSTSFSWENGDEIGVVVSGKYYRFTLEGMTNETTGTFTAELPAGISVEDGAAVAFPYVAEDYNESTHTFSLTNPTEYTSTNTFSGAYPPSFRGLNHRLSN